MRNILCYSLIILVLSLLLAGLLAVGSREAVRAERTSLPAKRQLTGTLGLTDLALWSEARYSRHPSQADLFTPFQDYPGALDHFPAGSIIAPPPFASQLETSAESF